MAPLLFQKSRAAGKWTVQTPSRVSYRSPFANFYDEPLSIYFTLSMMSSIQAAASSR